MPNHLLLVLFLVRSPLVLLCCQCCCFLTSYGSNALCRQMMPWHCCPSSAQSEQLQVRAEAVGIASVPLLVFPRFPCWYCFGSPRLPIYFATFPAAATADIAANPKKRCFDTFFGMLQMAPCY